MGPVDGMKLAQALEAGGDTALFALLGIILFVLLFLTGVQWRSYQRHVEFDRKFLRTTINTEHYIKDSDARMGRIEGTLDHHGERIDALEKGKSK